MEARKISELMEAFDITDNDLLAIVNEGKTKKVKFTFVKTFIHNLVNKILFFIDAKGHLIEKDATGRDIDLGQVKGEKGDKGEKGEKGDKGEKGEKGASGSGAVWRGTQAELQEALLITDPSDDNYIPNNAVLIITDADDTYLNGEEQ